MDDAPPPWSIIHRAVDPLAHTLIGATLGETRLQRRTPLARTTLIIAANLPDIDAMCMMLGRDAALGLRRGHTHGVLAMVLLPVILTGLIVLYDRGFRRPKGRPPVDPQGVLILASLGVLTHPFLDWLNNYGVRLLMPFSDKWFYGDAVFIVDPWIWLASGAAVMWANSRSKRSLVAWSVLGSLCTLAVWLAPIVPAAAKVGWTVGLAAVVALRVRGISPGAYPRWAVAALIAIGLYASAMVTGSAIARDRARAWYAERGIEIETVTVGPFPATPFRRNIIGTAKGRYHFAEYDALAAPPFRETDPTAPIGNGPVARRALAERPGLEAWIRLPAFEVKKLDDDGFRVEIRDVRYDRRGANLGRAVVRIPGP